MVTGFVSSGRLSAFDVIGEAWEIAGNDIVTTENKKNAHGKSYFKGVLLHFTQLVTMHVVCFA